MADNVTPKGETTQPNLTTLTGETTLKGETTQPNETPNKG